jgi:hypothetical protein
VSPGAKVIVDNVQKLREGADIARHPGSGAAPTAQTTNSAGK